MEMEISNMAPIRTNEKKFTDQSLKEKKPKRKIFLCLKPRPFFFLQLHIFLLIINTCVENKIY